MNKYIIGHEYSIREALIVLNQISSDAQSLLVVDNEQKLIGTLTDGDIRRGLISGAELSDSVNTIMHKDFKYIIESDFNVNYLREFKEKQILFIPVLNAQHKIVDVVNLKRYKSYLPIDAVLMAGGKGERLRPLTEKTPKPLLQVGTKCIIDHNVDRLISYGINHINVTVNYLAAQIEEHYAEPRAGVRIRTFREPQFLGTIGSIKFVDTFYNDTILVMNSDLFTNIDYEDLFLHFVASNADMCVAVTPYNVSVPYGIFDIDNREIKGIAEKPVFNYYANAGIYLLRKTVLEYIPSDEFFNATDLIEKLISINKKVISFPITGFWIDIGQHADLAKANEFIKFM